MKKNLFALLLATALLLTVACAEAATLQDTANGYANTGETAAAVNFTSGNAQYYMIKINGAESIVLKQDNGALTAVEGETTLTPLATDYLQQQFEAIGFAKKAAAIDSNYDVYEQEAGYCVRALKKLVGMTKATPPYMYIPMNKGRDYPKEYAALLNIEANLPDFENAVNTTQDAVEALGQIVSQGNADKSAQTFNQINSGASAFKTNFINISTSVATIKKSFANAFILQDDLKSHCALTSNQTAAVDAIINQSSLGAVKSAADLAKQIANATAARAPAARKKTLLSEEDSAISEINSKIVNVTRAYEDAATPVGASVLNLTVLWKQKSELDALRAQVNAGNGTENASTAFDAKTADTRSKIAFFEATLKDYSDSIAAVDNASREVDNVAKKYGADDDRIAALQKDLKSVRLLSQSYNDLLRDAMTTGSALQSVTANATDISRRAESLAPKENQIDLVLVGGVIILVGALIGAVYYLRSRKKQGKPDALSKTPSNKMKIYD